MNLYVQSYIVQAEAAINNGRNGYDVFYPDGRVDWIAEEDFDIHHRLFDRRERQLLHMRPDEMEVMHLTDADYRDREVETHPSQLSLVTEQERSFKAPDIKIGNKLCEHQWTHDAGRNIVYCPYCGIQAKVDSYDENQG